MAKNEEESVSCTKKFKRLTKAEKHFAKCTVVLLILGLAFLTVGIILALKTEIIEPYSENLNEAEQEKWERKTEKIQLQRMAGCGLVLVGTVSFIAAIALYRILHEHLTTRKKQEKHLRKLNSEDELEYETGFPGFMSDGSRTIAEQERIYEYTIRPSRGALTGRDFDMSLYQQKRKTPPNLLVAMNEHTRQNQVYDRQQPQHQQSTELVPPDNNYSGSKRSSTSLWVDANPENHKRRLSKSSARGPSINNRTYTIQQERPMRLSQIRSHVSVAAYKSHIPRNTGARHGNI